MEMEQWDLGTSFQENSNANNTVQYDGDVSYPQNDGYRNDNNVSNDYVNQNNYNNRSYHNNNNQYQPRYAPRHHQDSYNRNNYRQNNNNNYRRQQYSNNNHNKNRNRPRYQPRNNGSYDNNYSHNRQSYQYQPKRTAYAQNNAYHNTQSPQNTGNNAANEATSHHPQTSHAPSRSTNRFVAKKKFKRQIEDNLNFEPQSEATHTQINAQSMHAHTERATTQYVDESDPQIRHSSNRFYNNNRASFHAAKPKANTLELENLSKRATEMTQQLKNGKYDCMVCQSFIGKKARIWQCQKNCYTMFHLTCVNKWARAREQKDAETEQRPPKSDQLIDKIRCPACNYMDIEFKFNQYACFCSKVIFDHEHRASYLYATTPHSCGDICNKKRGTFCPHLCPATCHPGPCLPCNLPSDRKSSCPCGKLSYSLLCGQTETKQRLCKQICDKLLKCGNHRCASICHYDECKACDIESEQDCFCGKHTELKACGSGVQLRVMMEVNEDHESKQTEVIVYKYSCSKICGKQLSSCGHHRCTLICHNGSCSVCPRRIETPTRCACGKSTFADIQRESCLNPLPVCSKKCGRMLGCGQHFCKSKCHDSKCTLCKIQIKKRCRCGASEKKYKCYDYQKKLKHFISSDSNALLIEGQDSWIRCGKKCKRVKSCGKHTCAEICCTGRNNRTYFDGHRCRELCNKALECGRHRCTSYCHRGNCNPCGVTYRNGVQCACGSVYVQGPFQCGTKHIPQCKESCDKILSCDHRCSAKCHDGDCPPCIRTCSKACNSHGLMVHNMPCHVDNRSCGNPCGRLLDCGVHRCLRTCHNGICVTNVAAASKSCGQICNLTIKCGHKCMSRCHGTNKCNVEACKAQITVKCKCGNNWEKQYCRGRTEYDLKAVPCSEDCAIAQRNQRFRQALNINASSKKQSQKEDPDLMMIPYAGAVLERIIKWMHEDKAHHTIIKLDKKIISPKFVYKMERIFDAYIADESDDCHVFKSQHADITVLASHHQNGAVINLRPMNNEQRYIVYCMSTQYHIRCEKKENSGKHSSSYMELSKSKNSRVSDYLLSAALIEYQVAKHKVKTLESMPPQTIIVIDAGADVSSSLIQDRLLAWVGDYRMYRNNNDQLFIVFTDEKLRNSAISSLKTFGVRKATKADSFSANAAVNKKQQQKKKKLKAAQQQQQLGANSSYAKSKSNQGWKTIGDSHVKADEMTKYKPHSFDVKMNNRFG